MHASVMPRTNTSRTRAVAVARSRREHEIDRYCLRLERLLDAGCPLLVADSLAQGSPLAGATRAALAAAAPATAGVRAGR